MIWGSPELPTTTWTIRWTTRSEGLSGRWNTITSRTARLSTGTRSLMATPPTDSPGRMLPERIGVTIQVPRTRARLATPTAARTATSRTAATTVRTGLAVGVRLALNVRLAWACLGRERAVECGVPPSATALVVMIPPGLAERRGTGARCYERFTRDGDRRHRWPRPPVRPITVEQRRHSYPPLVAPGRSSLEAPPLRQRRSAGVADRDLRSDRPALGCCSQRCRR